MHSHLLKRIEIPEAWFDAFLFSFKVVTVLTSILLFVWYVTLPSNHSNRQIDSYDGWHSAYRDFAFVANTESALCFLAAGMLTIGGLIQLFKYSRRAAIWSMAFGFLALVSGTVGIVSATHFSDLARQFFRG